jgi:hypothetical protein
MLRLVALCVWLLIQTDAVLAQTFAPNSVLSEGQWLKIAIVEEGLYKISGQWLRQQGWTQGISPSQLHLYSAGNGMLPQRNSAPRIDDLQPVAIWLNNPQAPAFQEQDFFLFYAQGAHQVRIDTANQLFLPETNLYADTNYYFLTLHDHSSLQARLQPQADLGAASVVFEHFDDYWHHEQERVSLLLSGRQWYGETFNDNTLHTFNINTEGLLPNSPLKLRIQAVGGGTQSATLSIRANNTDIGQLGFPILPQQRYDPKVQEVLRTFDFAANTVGNPGAIRLDVRYNRQGNNNLAYLDYLTLQIQRRLAYYNSPTVFRTFESLQYPTAAYRIAQTQAGAVVWDISNPLQPKLQNKRFENGQTVFAVATAGLLRSFLVFQGENFPPPIAAQRINNQNLHASPTPNLLIITHPSLQAEAEQLAAFRRNHDGLNVLVVNTVQVYHEFSGGRPDLTALRDFIRMLYTRQPEQLRYVLLFGAASVDYKNRLPNNSNLVPIYESRESIHPIFSYASDDYFGFLEPEEGEWVENFGGDHTLEVGIGRLPARTPTQAAGMVQKLIRYSQSNAQQWGNWRSLLTFVADDGDFNIHQLDAEQLSQQVLNNAPAYKPLKKFLDAFPRELGGAGATSPKLTESLLERIDKGSLIVNYTGHGAETGWAEEDIMNAGHWQNLRNTRLPLVVTATCEFGRYDNPTLTSGAQLAILNPLGGAIGLITTTRPVFSSTNFALNQAFYQVIFQANAAGQPPRLGEVMRLTKNAALRGAVNRNFSLLGDPSMRLNYPKHQTTLTQISADTLRALQEIRLQGEVRDTQGQRLSTFNGLALVTLHDKPLTRRTLGVGAPAMNFQEVDNPLFRGQVRVVNGQYEAAFIIPQNINYQLGEGNLRVYAYDSLAATDAHGINTLVVGGSAPLGTPDRTPPTIRMWINDESFVSGQAIEGDRPVLGAALSDESGINISTAGLNNAIRARLRYPDGRVREWILNEEYVADLDTYQSGRLRFALPRLEAGTYQLSLEAWDVWNNSTEEQLSFVVNPILRIGISLADIYPNPMSENATLRIRHDQAGEDLSLTLQLVDNQGRLVQTWDLELLAAPETILLPWDGRDSKGMKIHNGTYICRVWLRSKLRQIEGRQSIKILVAR